ncbi:MAG: hypothetical protein ACI88A_000003 [Paraglaciecola sp.]|jgi:hypothetical protein
MNFSKKVKPEHRHPLEDRGETSAAKSSAIIPPTANQHWSQLSQGHSLSQAPEGTIQREDKDEEQGLDYKLIPPSVSYRLGDFSASADTSGAKLGYGLEPGTLGLGYNYGKDFSASAKYGFLDGKLAFDPSADLGSLSLGGKHNDFKYGLGADTSGKGNLSFGGSHGGFNYNLGANTGGEQRQVLDMVPH